MPNDVIIDVVVNADQAVATMGQVTAKTEQVAAATSVSGAEFRRAGTALGHFGQAMTNILVLSNLLPGSIGKGVSATLLLATTTINAVYAVSQLVKIYQELAKAQRIQIALQSVLAALSGFGIAKVALAAGVGVAAYAGATALNRNDGGGGGNTNITISNGVLMGNDADARRLARQIQQNLRDDQRLGR